MAAASEGLDGWAAPLFWWVEYAAAAVESI